MKNNVAHGLDTYWQLSGLEGINLDYTACMIFYF